MGNELGFMTGDIALLADRYRLSTIELPYGWDRQTIVMVCEDNDVLNEIRDMIRDRRRPNTVCNSVNYGIDGFINLNYKMYESDPANRVVRIVYCNRERMTFREISDRFQCGYIIRVERSESNGTPRISREIPEVSG